MVNRLLIVTALISLPALCIAQNVDYNKIIVPGSPSSLSDEEKLVQLAWKNYPGNEALYYEVTAAEANINIQRWDWLNLISAQGNLNEFTINPDPNNPDDRALYYPRYNFGVRIPMGIFVTIPNETKRAKAMKDIAEANIDRQKLNVRATIMGFYRQYLTYIEIYKIEKQASDDADDIFKLEEQKFKNGEITLDKYNISVDSKNIKKIRTIAAENDFLQMKYKIEEFIGMRLEDALAK